MKIYLDMIKYLVIIPLSNEEIFRDFIYAFEINVLEGGQIALYNEKGGYIAILPSTTIIVNKDEL
jgi:hypothetical protein